MQNTCKVLILKKINHKGDSIHDWYIFQDLSECRKEASTLDAEIHAYSDGHSSSKASKVLQNSDAKESNDVDKKLMNLARNKKNDMLFFLIQGIKS